MRNRAASRVCGLASVLAFVGGPSALAADLAVKAPVYKAPVESAHSWTGFYVGGEVGGIWGHEVASTLFSTALSTAGTRTPGNASSVLGGVDVGYNYQFDRNWILGVQADWAWTNANSSGTIGSNVPGISLGGSTNERWISAVTGRVGYVVNEWLLYGKGGVAFSRFSYNANATAGTTILENATTGVTRTGAEVGVGGERKLAQNLSAKLEYDYIGFGTKQVLFTFPGIGTNGANISTHSQVVKAGLNFLFHP